MEGLSTLVEYTLRSAAVCLITALALCFLRKSAAVYRHLVCVLSLVILLTLPLLHALLPPIPLPQGFASEQYSVPAIPAPPITDSIAPIAIPPMAPPVLIEPPTDAPPIAPPIPPPSRGPSPILPLLWLTGVVLLLARLAFALIRLAGMKAASLPASVEQTDWLAVLAHSQRLAIPIALRIGPADTAPVTWGVFRPVILLPESLTTDDAGESAARHELAHIARRDWLWQMLAEVVCALYWFQPGVWWLRHRLRTESERACDDAVLLSGVDATDYASHLLRIARQCRRPGTPWVAPLAMARPRGLELRLGSILNDQLPRQSSPSRRLGIIALALPLLGVTALSGVASSKSSNAIAPPAPPLAPPPLPPSLPAPPAPIAPAVAPPAPPVPPAKPQISWVDSLQNFLPSSFRFPSLSGTIETTPHPGNPSLFPQVAPPAPATTKAVTSLPKAAGAIAWGKTRNGLQVGLRLPAGVSGFSSLQNARFDVLIRNTTAQSIAFGWWGYPTIEQFSPELFTTQGKPIRFIRLLAGPYLKHSERLEADQQKSLGTLYIPVTATVGAAQPDAFAGYLGQFRARFGLSVDFSDGKGELPGRDEVVTGDLTFSVVRDKAKPATATSTPLPIQKLSLTPNDGLTFPLRSEAVRWRGNNTYLLTLGQPTFRLDPNTQRLTATSDAGLVTFDAVTYTVTATIYNAAGKALGTAQTKVPIQRVWLGQTLSTSHEVQFDFGPSAQFAGAARYSLSISQERVLTPDEWAKDPYDQAKAYLEKIREARKQKDDKTLWVLFIDQKFDEYVNVAAEHGDEAMLSEFIQQSWFGGPCSGGNGVTWAAYYPTEKPIATLLKWGVPADVANASGDTGLHLSYRVEIARLLLDRGAKLEVRNRSGQTPLIAQAFRGNHWTGRGILPLLLERSANVDAVDNDGMTALMYAAKQGMVEDVKALLQRGADRQRKDNKGKMVRDYAAPWAWQNVPGFLTQERARELEAEAKWDQYRITQLLEGKPDPGASTAKKSGE